MRMGRDPLVSLDRIFGPDPERGETSNSSGRRGTVSPSSLSRNPIPSRPLLSGAPPPLVPLLPRFAPPAVPLPHLHRFLPDAFMLNSRWQTLHVNRKQYPAMATSSLAPPEVPMELHAGNRDRLLTALHAHLSAAASPPRGLALLQGGEEQTRHCTDHLELFRQESYFAYLFGVREPGFYGAIDIASGQSILFAPRLPPDYAVWMGEIKPLPYFKDRYKVDLVFYVDEIVQVLQDRFSQHGKPVLFLLYGKSTDSGNYSKPASFEGIEKFDTDLSTLHPILTECRVIKSGMELALIQYANDVSSEAHIEVMRQAKPGMKEYQLESIFLHHSYRYGACRHCSYTCICATGENRNCDTSINIITTNHHLVPVVVLSTVSICSILHYGHTAAPNDRTLNDGDMALMDMGAEYNFYGSDITCSYPINGKFNSNQAIVYNAVLKAHNAVISHMQPGLKWVDMHKLAEQTILESLKNEKIIHGDIADMMARRLGAVFMPHGLGHLLGIDTHDPGGYPEGLERPKEPGLSSLRTIRELKEGMVITVEPGCYFIDALLRPARDDPISSKFFNWEEIEKYKSFGGVRIESDLYVTAQGCKNLTNCPRETWEIEAVMAGAPWPPRASVTKAENGLPKA
ncbi:xaa-Pro dipeptidase-like isoform X4 [Triticum dicoccoides]|uniref:xaa-Pro dipeptidase-like isoform X4 n=1 Tax=Triticum dicoccoides TaxID=85692 RepID=UPI001891D125|nr:xaa-Pro dipeptidase-like isoform X4 [Triticum dicoccoides]